MGILQALELEEFENDPEFWKVAFDDVDGMKSPPLAGNTNRERTL